MRMLVDTTNLIDTVSKPIRNPVLYRISWNGRDDDGYELVSGVDRSGIGVSMYALPML